MSTADFSDIARLQAEYSDIRSLIRQLKQVVEKHGVALTLRVVAVVLGPRGAKNFIKAHEVKETNSLPIPRIPSALVGKEPDTWRARPLQLNHASL